MKLFKILGILFIFILLLVSCNDTPDDPNIPIEPDVPVIDDPVIEDPVVTTEIKLGKVEDEIKIKDEDVSTYDFTKLFTITKIEGDESTKIVVDSSYLDLSNIDLNKQYARIVLNYDNKKIYKDIEIIKTIYNVETVQEEVILKPSQLANYDFKSLFNITKDGTNIDVLDEYLTNNIQNTAGNYEVTLTIKDITKQVKVTIIPEHIIDIVKRYQSTTIEISKINDLKVCELFTLYVDNNQKEVKDEYLTYDFTNIQVNDEKEVIINYEEDGVKETSNVLIKVIPDNEITVETKNVVTYPNSSIIDLSSLFIIKLGDEIIPTPLENITGTVDVSTPGINNIVLNYHGQTYTATVEVIHGVVITTKSDKIQIKLGTSKENYNFAGDFILNINGIRYLSIPDSYLDYSSVDFNTLGTYQVILKVPYNSNKITLAGAKFTYYEKTITYEVVPNIYSIKVLNDLVVINQDDDLLDIINDNLAITLNSFTASITNSKDAATYIRTIYSEIKSIIDYTSSAIQEVTVDIYPYRDYSKVETIKFNVRVNQGIEITPHDTIIFTGNSVNLTSLFTIKLNDQEIDVRGSMIEGYVDNNQVGDYYLTLTYENISSTVKVSVYDSLMKGTFKTALKTIGSTSDVDDEGYQIGEDTESVRVSDFIINDDGTYTFGTRNVTLTESIDQTTQIITIGTNKYTLTFNNGILILIPKNEYSMKYSNYRRPYVFFSDKVYKIENFIEINSGSDSVLETDSSNVYTLSLFEIRNLETNEISYYCMKNRLIEHLSSDYKYEVQTGFVKLNNDFAFATATSGVITFDKAYEFTISNKVGKIVKKDDNSSIYTGKTFTGYSDKTPLSLAFLSDGSLTFRVNGELILSTTVSAIKQDTLSYLDEVSNQLFITSGGSNPYTYSIKINTENNTITLNEEDHYVGLYTSGDDYIYLNGFGTGYILYNDAEYTINYTTQNEQIVLKYIYQNTEETIELYIPKIYNTLSVTRSSRSYFNDKVYLINEVKYGALVEFDNYIYGKNTSTDLIYDSLKITTKDGVLTKAEMLGNIPSTNIKYVDKTRVHFGKAGYYLLVVNIPVLDDIVSMNYTVEVLDINSDAQELKGVYTALFNEQLIVTIDEYARVQIAYCGDLYEGLLVKSSNNTYYVNAFINQSSEIFILFDKINVDKVFYIKISGSISLVDYLVNYQVKSTGNETYILYVLTNNENTYYLFGKSGSVNLVIVNPVINGDTYTITYEDQTITFKINAYSSTDGLEIIE